MFSRHTLREFAQQHFHVEALPLLEQIEILTGILAVLSERYMPNSELCKCAFTDHPLQTLAIVPRHIIANFLALSAGLVSPCQALAETDARTMIYLRTDRTRHYFHQVPPHGKRLVPWNPTKSASHWPTLWDSKEQVASHVEESGDKTLPSQNSCLTG